jgi:hypothetical protein
MKVGGIVMYGRGNSSVTVVNNGVGIQGVG